MERVIEMEDVRCRLIASLTCANCRYCNSVLNAMDLTGIVGERVPIQTTKTHSPCRPINMGPVQKQMACSYGYWYQMRSYQHAGFNVWITSTETRMSTNNVPPPISYGYRNDYITQHASLAFLLSPPNRQTKQSKYGMMMMNGIRVLLWGTYKPDNSGLKSHS